MNDDGAGFAYQDNGQVIIEKGFFKFKTFWKAYRKHENKLVLIHFRFATHGLKDRNNCHPFPLAGSSALIHNGILTKFMPSLTQTQSDTALFCETFLEKVIAKSKLPIDEFLGDKILRDMLEEILGTSNKIAILTAKQYYIFNGYLGDWVNGVWYSAGFPDRWQDSVCYGNVYRTSGERICSAYACMDDCVKGFIWCEEHKKQYVSPHTADVMTISGILSEDELSEDHASLLDEYSDDEDEDEDEDSPAYEKTVSPVCSICNEVSSRLYQIGCDEICTECWHTYTGPSWQESRYDS